jgi:hypothetical protein
MCFYQGDCDWRASVYEVRIVASAKTKTCNECCTKIFPGTPYAHTYMQEWEFCRDCEQSECQCCDTDECCKCEEPSIGETYEENTCLDCHKFLQAIEAAEIEAGCGRNESRPMLGELIESLSNSDRKETKRYWKKARIMFPELVTNGYLADMWGNVWR